MGRKQIHKYSPGFQLLLLGGALYHRVFFRRFKVMGRDRVPVDSPVIFTSNHQNGLMDPLAVIFAARRQVVFFARADIFRKKVIARLLYFIKILPIYRIRDGFRSVDRNRDMLDEAATVLINNRAVGLFPEGNHDGRKRLRPLKKGAARLALQAEAGSGFTLGLKIIPVGIDYSDYFTAGSDLLVIFGDPVHIEPFRKAFLENPPRAVTDLTHELASATKKVIIDIEPENDYDSIHLASELYSSHLITNRKTRKSLYQSFLVKKKVTEELNRLYKEEVAKGKELTLSVRSLSDSIHRNGIDPKMVSSDPPALFHVAVESAIMLIMLPIYLYGALFHWVPYRLPFYFSRKVKDKHLRLSVRFGAGFFTFGLWYLLIVAAVCLIPAPQLIKLIFLLSLPFTGLFSFYYFRNILKMRSKLQWFRLKRNRKEEYDQLTLLRDTIIDFIKKLDL